MGLWRRETRAERPLTDVELLSIFNPGAQTHTGVKVTPTEAMRLTAVYRATTLLAGLVAGLPLKAYQGTPRTETDVAILRHPHPSATGFELWERVVLCILLHGNAYLVKVQNRAGDVVALLPLDPTSVTVKLSHDGIKSFDVPSVNGGQTTVGAETILHVPGPSLDGIVGLSPVSTCREAIGLGLATEEYAARMFGSGAMLGGVLQTDETMTAEQADDARRSFREKTRGLSKAHEVAVLHRGLKFQPITMKADDAQLILSRHFTVEDIARIFGVPPHLLAESEGSTSWGSGLAEQTRGLLTFTLAPLLNRIESRVTAELLLPGELAEFQRAGLLQASPLDEANVLKIEIDAGILTINEARALRNLPPRPEVVPRVEVVTGA